jgi:hypothetical protein
MAKNRVKTEEPPSRPAPESPPDPPADPLVNGRAAEPGHPKQPVFKVGPIASDKDHAVSAAVWQNEITLHDGRKFTVHNVTFEAAWRDSDGNWKTTHSFRGSQLYVLWYCIERCNTWILAQRDPADVPF